MQRPRILLITTGGTISMLPSPDGFLAPSEDGVRLLEKIPEAAEIADLESLSLGEQDSANVQPPFWVDVAQTVYERYRDYDGFVVTHGTDTMVYLASALSFFLQELGKPIVITGAQVPLTHPGSDGRSNLVNAIRAAASDLAEVAICFGTLVMRGTRTRKTSA
ncbi:MAG: asparaginase, partial [Deltaproteobacteria bacterium]|nr:asparaginase [Deltaproteobacteria bacterium]